MSKTPDEIKMGLVEAIEEASWVVEGGDAHDLIDAVEKAHASMADALACIRQLEAERNKAVKDLVFVCDCRVCKHYGHKANEGPCRFCGIRQAHWEWRGLPEPPKEE